MSFFELFNPFPKDHLIEVAKGNIPGSAIINVSGRNSAVGVSFEDIWGGGTLSTLDYDAQIVNFTPGLVLTQASSGATATIVIDDDSGTTGTLTIRGIAGIFVDDQVITDSGSGSATADGVTSSLSVLTYPTANETWEIICESADDDLAGIGARTVLINYLDDSRDPQFEIVDLSGQAASVFTATDGFRLGTAVVLTWGSAVNALFGKANLGTIVIRDSVSKNVRGIIEFDDSILGDEHGLNNGRSSFYTVPNGKTSHLLSLIINTSKNHEAVTILLGRSFPLEGFQSLGEQSVYQNTVDFDFCKRPVLIDAKTDVKLITRSNNAAVDVNATMGFLQVDD